MGPRMSLDGLGAPGARVGTMKPADPKPGRCSRRSGTRTWCARRRADTPAILYVDLHLIHEVTSPQAFTWLRERGLKVRRPERTVATMDHSTPTTPRGRDGTHPGRSTTPAAAQIAALEKNCADFGIELHALGQRAGRGSCTSSGPSWG